MVVTDLVVPAIDFGLGRFDGGVANGVGRNIEAGVEGLGRGEVGVPHELAVPQRAQVVEGGLQRLALDAALEYEIMRQEAQSLSVGEAAAVSVPDYLGEVVATFSQLARASSHVNQRSGVSVRLSVSNYEALAANALRRGLRAGERAPAHRLWADLAATAGWRSPARRTS